MVAAGRLLTFSHSFHCSRSLFSKASGKFTLIQASAEVSINKVHTDEFIIDQNLQGDRQGLFAGVLVHNFG
jgi:hypothetical protein